MFVVIPIPHLSLFVYLRAVLFATDIEARGLGMFVVIPIPHLSLFVMLS